MFTSNDLNPAPYNPRTMSEKALKGLKKSVKEFSDISGITWNKRTKNIVTGHHRWKILCDLYGQKNLVFVHIENTDRYRILNKKKDTSYVLRVVDWDEAKEKAANVLANSHAIEGQFTEELQSVLADIKVSMDDVSFEELNLPELEIPAISDKAPDKQSEKKEETKKKKSETLVSSGGEKYKTVKLELSPKLADRLRTQLERLSKDADSVETPLDAILTFIEATDADDILSLYSNKKSKEKEAKRKRKG